jgi:hypothetical protein
MGDGYFGLYSARVEDNHDPKGHGRLQLAAPQLFEPNETVWAKPLLPYGFFFIPEIGDLAWMQFEGGELDNPVWIGAQIVRGGWPSEAPSGDPDVRILKSASGHVIVMSDGTGAETMEINSPTRLVIRSAGSIEIQAPVVVINGRPIAPLPSSFTI